MTQTIREKTRDKTKTPLIPHTEAHPIPPKKIGLAFQGGSFLAGALSTGVVLR